MKECEFQNTNYTPNSSCSLTAKFKAQFTVTVQSEDTNKGTTIPNGNETCLDGESINIAAFPKSGWAFDGWYLNGLKISSSQNTIFIPTATCTLIAKFLPEYSVTLQSEDINKGTVSGSGTCVQGSFITVSASPKSGWAFEGWYLNGSKISSVTPYNYYAAATCTLIAKFMGIDGNNTVCYEGSVFTLNSPPASTITWTLSAGSPFSFNPPDQPALTQKTTSSSPHQVTVYRTGTGVSSGTLTATNVSGSYAAKSFMPCTLSIMGDGTVCYGGSQYTLNYPPKQGITTYYWTVTGPFSFSSSSSVTQTTTYPPTVYKTTASGSGGTLSAHIVSYGGAVVASKNLGVCVPSISGPNELCFNSGNYTLNNAQGITIYWTVDNNSYSVTSSGNPVTVSYTGQFGVSSMTLSARNGSTSGTVIATKSINHCSPNISGPSIVCNNGSNFTLQNAPPGTIYWSVDNPNVLSVNPSGNPTTVTRTGPGTGNHKIRAHTGSPIGPIITDLIISTCSDSIAIPVAITGFGNICNSGSAVFSINNGQSAAWSVTAGFSLSTSSGASTTVSATTPDHYGTLTAVVGGVTCTKSIQSSATPDCYFPPTDFVYMTNLPCGAYVHLIPYPSDDNPYAIYKWVVYFEDNVSYDITSGQDATLVNVLFSSNNIGTLRIDAHQYISPHGYSPHPTVEYRLGSDGCSRSPSLIKVYPNPVSGVLNIEITDKAIDRARAFASTADSRQSGYAPVFDIRLYDVLGNLVKQQTSKGGTERFNVSGLPNGIYFLNVDDGISKTPETIQVIVRH